MVNRSGLIERRTDLSRLDVVWNYLLRSLEIGLIAGGTYGGLMGLLLLRGRVGSYLLGVGMILGLAIATSFLLSAVTCLCFYPLKQVQPYRWTIRLIGACIAGGLVSLWILWSFSAARMTPGSATLIGLQSVLIAIVAGLIGDLGGQNMTQWYERRSAAASDPTARPIRHNIVTLSKTADSFKAIFPAAKLGWLQVVILSFVLPLLGFWLLELLMCGSKEAYDCLTSPRLFTSAQAGWMTVLPIIALAIALLKQYRIHLQIDQQTLFVRHELFGQQIWRQAWSRATINGIRLSRPRFGHHFNITLHIGQARYRLSGKQLGPIEAQWLAHELSDWLSVPLERTQR